MDLIAIDVAHMGNSNSSEGYQYCLVIVDVATRFVSLCPLRNNTGKEAATEMIKVFNMIGWPKAIVCDGGREFVNRSWDQLIQEAAILNHITAPYHHRSNGLVERTIQSFKVMTKKYMEQMKLKEWDLFATWIQAFLNTRITELT